MNPIYKFELTAGGVTQRAYPIYDGNLSKDYEKESNQQFFRAKLSGKLTFERNDYQFIISKAFDTQFLIDIYISYDAGGTWLAYWNGTFWKTDCDFDDDDRTVVVQPTVRDQYNDILSGLDKEYNLIDLAPEIMAVGAQKRPMIQLYVPGQTVIGCFLSGMWWEQECESVLESDTVTVGNQQYKTLEYKYHFSLNQSLFIAEVSGSMSPQLPELFTESYARAKFNPINIGTQDFTSGEYTFRYYFAAGSSGYAQRLQILRQSTVLWEFSRSGTSFPDFSLPQTYTLSPVSGSGATGDVTLYLHEIPVYSRVVLDKDTLLGLQTYEIPEDDIVENNRNYRRVIGYAVSGIVYFSSRLSAEPTQWGIYQPGQYYLEPYVFGETDFVPVSRNAWGRCSVWYMPSIADQVIDGEGREPFVIRNAYPIYSVISVLLGKVAPGVVHEGTTAYSEFLYGANPITGVSSMLFFTPKSNLVYSGYDQPAQKAMIKLRDVLEMLRDCFRCYWYIDEDGKFKIEHIKYFMNGGSYVSSPSYGVDLTAISVPRNMKAWSYMDRKYSYDKPEMTSRYQFGWMDDVTQIFDGYPVNILAKYVNQDSIEDITVSQFTSDVDYILLNPSAVSKDGFVLLCAIPSGMGYSLPFYTFNDSGNSRVLQNGYVSFSYLVQNFYKYDMPAPEYEINGIIYSAAGTKKYKSQSVSFPALNDPDMLRTIRTNLGYGTIEKLSVNLSSRSVNGTLKYDTE